MAKKKQYSPQREEYEKQLSALKRRQKEWVKTKHMVVSNIPEKKSHETYSQAAKRLQDVRLSSFTEEEKQEYRKNYEIMYEDGNITKDINPNDAFTPPTEDDFYKGHDGNSGNLWEETENEPVKEEEEYAAEIEELIEEVVSVSDVREGREYVRGTLRNLLNNSRTQMGDKVFYKFLKENNALKDLQDAAQDAIYKYIKKGQNYDSEVNSLIALFATILNRNRPLTDEQAYTLEVYGTIDYDYDE